MKNAVEVRIRQLLNEFRKRFSAGLDKAQVSQVELLIHQFYRHLPADELNEYDSADLIGAVVAHWQLFKDRIGGAAAVRVYNPNIEEHGWQSSHTVIEIVTEDMAFLVGSISMMLNRAGFTIFLTIHPIVYCLRDDKGNLLELRGSGSKEGTPASLIKFHIEKQPSDEILRSLRRQVMDIIHDVTRANQDWKPMKSRVKGVWEEIRERNPDRDGDEAAETLAFLEWIENDHFTLLAYCELDYTPDGPQVTPDTSLGLLRGDDEKWNALEQIIPLSKGGGQDDRRSLVTTKANRISTIHRPAYMDYIGIKRYNVKGEIDGEYCILGLYSSTAYSRPPTDIPVLRQKVQAVMDGARLVSRSHAAKAMMNILVTLPRDTLFQITREELLEIAVGILGLQERQRTRLFMFKDSFDRFYSCLVYVPKEVYSRELRLRIQKVLVEGLGGTEAEFETRFSESILARVHFVVHTLPGSSPKHDAGTIEQQVIEASLTWQDGLRAALIEKYGESKAARYNKEYAQAFPGGFREDFMPRTAAVDVERIERARKTGQLALHFYHPILESDKSVYLRLYSVSQPVPLSEAIPILENMGLTVMGERPYRLRLEKDELWIHDFSMKYPKGGREFSDRVSRLLEEAFMRIWNQETDNDGFNQLVLRSGMSWQKVVVLRAYSGYLKQIRSPYSQSYLIDSLSGNPEIARNLVELFTARFSPKQEKRDKRIEDVLARIEKRLDSVSSLDQDRIIRHFVNLIQSTLRTNYFQPGPDGSPRGYLSFKMDSRLVSDMPLPKPMFEIFVFSSRMEGVHLRGGRVARGGLRWSDRMEDFRTEVLGLMKAQMVKNTVIVPTGSKGGFVVKTPLSGMKRERQMEEVVRCYRTLLCGMLDLTDNYEQGEVKTPDNLVKYDEDDPYLVIAADKGTATFSDIANGIAGEYGFWLGDAFASGGSAGYDHKKMGITARGAWESVKRNFREMGVDIQSQDFRVIGIGDMSGDVFGNGMLRSRHIRLVGAFNHQHIFIDPDPDPEATFRERQRLFEMRRSSWEDYDAGLISQGGGIYSRAAKSIVISEEIKALFGIKEDRLIPLELIRYMLKASVDLLWNGGIGTYVKAAEETHEAVSDKANDGLRVNGAELRCKVIGEGGNLGFTQLGRVEFARKGGLIYTDSIDNSAGVDCSDHEVNIKILLNQILSTGDMTLKQRNQLLAEMTDEVADLVLANNYSQSQSISIIASQAAQRVSEHARFINWLESQGRLERSLEYLPDNKEIARRQAENSGLTKPEIAVLHSYSKMNYYEALIQSEIPDDAFLVSKLENYFPGVLGERYSGQMANHQLKREIIATHLTNDIVDHIGPGFGFRMREEVGANIAGVTRAYLAASMIFDTDRLWQLIESLDNRVAAGIQIEMLLKVSRMLERTVNWILRYRQGSLQIRELVDYFRPGVAELMEKMPKPLAAQDRLELNRQTKRLTNSGVPREVAMMTAALIPLTPALDIVEVAKQTGTDIPVVASLYYRLGSELQLHWLQQQITRLNVRTHWHNLANIGLASALNSHQRELTSHILERTGKYRSAKTMMDRWAEKNPFTVDRHNRMISEMKAQASLDFAMLSVVVANVGGLLVSNIQPVKY